jgi:hypothetical protein
MAQQPLDAVGSFRPYLDAVIRSGQRTRGVVYVTLLILFFTACGIRNEVYPAWDFLRLGLMQNLYHCVIDQHSSNDCEDVKVYEKPKCSTRLSGQR